MEVKFIKGYTLADLEAQLGRCINHSFQPTLCIFFCSVGLDFNACRRMLEHHGLEVFGATSAGEIVNADISEQSAVGMLLDMPPDSFQVILRNAEDQGIFECSRSVAQEVGRMYDEPIILAACAGISNDGEAVVKGFQAELGEEVRLFGGLAADDFHMENTYVFNATEVSNNGLAVLILNGNTFTVKGLATGGWQAVGIEKLITRSEGNIVYTIDNEPALDVFKSYFGLPEDMDAKKDVVANIGVQYPLHVYDKEGNAVIRAPLIGNDDDGSLIFAGGVAQGATVKFSVPPSFEILDRVFEETQYLKRAIPDADILILFSCKARHIALGPLIYDEIQGLRKLWNVPMLGFFTYGEIGALRNRKCEFHNETCMLVAIKEKK
ncbi:MAG: FIST N-terminal domain-containing protein [Bacteroidia bacterium]